MLKFLDAQHHRQQRKTMINFLPEMVYGHTRESSPHMLNKHSIFYKSTQKVFPNLKPLEVKLPPCVKGEFNISTQGKSDSSQKQYRRKSRPEVPFGIAKGQFTTFLDRHKHYSSIGTIYKDQSDKDLNKKNPILKSQWNKSTNSNNLLTDSQLNEIRQSSIFELKSKKNSTIMPSMPSKSIPLSRSSSVSIIQKSINKLQIKMRRQQFAQNAIKDQDQRRKTLCGGFSLPNKGVNHELYFTQGWRRGGERKGKDETELMNSQLQVFERKLMKRFK